MAIEDLTVKLTDPRWWVAEVPERLAQGAAILGVHPEVSAQAADAIACAGMPALPEFPGAEEDAREVSWISRR